MGSWIPEKDFMGKEQSIPAHVPSRFHKAKCASLPYDNESSSRAKRGDLPFV
jgi:hypothetical protein